VSTGRKSTSREKPEIKPNRCCELRTGARGAHGKRPPLETALSSGTAWRGLARLGRARLSVRPCAPCVPPQHHDHDQDAHNAPRVARNARSPRQPQPSQREGQLDDEADYQTAYQSARTGAVNGGRGGVPLQQVLQRLTATNGCPPSEVCGDLQRHRLSTGSAVNQPFVRPVWLDRSRPVPESRRFDRGFDLRPTTHSEGKGR
jgi:hypothetical protein